MYTITCLLGIVHNLFNLLFPLFISLANKQWMTWIKQIRWFNVWFSQKKQNIFSMRMNNKQNINNQTQKLFITICSINLY